MSVDCPHQRPSWRARCPGCTASEPDDGFQFCDGEVTGKVTRDVEGDAGVIGGLHSILLVEDIELSFGCELTQQEQETVEALLCEDYADDLADLYEHYARLEMN